MEAIAYSRITAGDEFGSVAFTMGCSDTELAGRFRYLTPIDMAPISIVLPTTSGEDVYPEGSSHLYLYDVKRSFFKSHLNPRNRNTGRIFTLALPASFLMWSPPPVRHPSSTRLRNTRSFSPREWCGVLPSKRSSFGRLSVGACGLSASGITVRFILKEFCMMVYCALSEAVG